MKIPIAVDLDVLAITIFCILVLALLSDLVSKVKSENGGNYKPIPKGMSKTPPPAPKPPPPLRRE